MNRAVTYCLVFILLALSLPAKIEAQCLDTVYTGTATFYTVSSAGYCSLPVPASPKYVAAVNDAQYYNSLPCGGCIAVTSTKGTVVLSIFDNCTSCGYGNLDISDDIRTLISDNYTEPVSWKFVACPVSGNINLYITPASNPYYLQVQVRNHRYPVSNVEYFDGSAYVTMTRQADNTFYYNASIPVPDPFDLRITDVLGDMFEAKSIPFLKDSLLDAKDQFALCLGTDATVIQKKNLGIELLNNTSRDGQFILVNNNDHEVSCIITDITGRTISIFNLRANNQMPVQLQGKGIYLLNCIFQNKSSLRLKVCSGL